MPWITTFLLSLILLLQYPLWLGKGSWPHLQKVEHEFQIQKQKNAELKVRNTAMEAEIQDLKRGYDAIEERARSELGMVKPKEILYEYLTPPSDHTVLVVPMPDKQPVTSQENHVAPISHPKPNKRPVARALSPVQAATKKPEPVRQPENNVDAEEPLSLRNPSY
ncbi:MAG: cell division protein FtsB [Pseudomonadota bacterium]